MKLIIKVGNIKDVIKDFTERFHVKGIYSHEETGNEWTFKRDKDLKSFTNNENINWYEYRQFGVFRALKKRKNWSQKWEQHMSEKLINNPRRVNYFVDIPSHSLPASKSLNLNSDKCSHQIQGGRRQGLHRLNEFVKYKIDNYQYSLSSPLKAFNGCSRLSPYLTWGCLSMREVVQAIRKTKKRESRAIDSRLHWHCHFIQKLETEPELENREHHPHMSGIRKSNPIFLEAWSQGLTGIPFTDACMRSLNSHGWINFRMRAMFMSFASYQLWLPWQESGLCLARKFIDYEPGIHWTQCQIQSGTTAINTIRIYNPIKQGYDHDPEGIFIRTWVKELQYLPTQFIHEPWKIDLFRQNNSSFILGKNYPLPIVDQIISTKTARAKLKERRSKPGFFDIANNILEKHSSRKSRKSKLKKNQNYADVKNQLTLKL
ncbi:FAD-binding domain-containing protein [Prochlorococcus marinus]|uniref:Deoxyribodipyrimidine photolyase n=1 Tax=Prochlorococcus marinus str. P0902-H212 TaxID=1620696 RepID=A0A0D5A2G6_PROMR|nr:FAD-binding domain-containing protein [Prochlorococcus marinus]AJW30505.1 Deoxyribodipyrimidine photolyase [Prochlorococcus marinus str. P0902-H212]